MQQLLSLDQGTTSTRAIIFDTSGQVLSQYQVKLSQNYPKNGWVEHDPEEIWQASLQCLKAVIADSAEFAGQISAMGITNQRETTVVWDKTTGETIHPAIVWQDRRTASYCQQLLEQDLNQMIHETTGLLIDPYFSATKLKWLLDNISGAREKAQAGELLFGTIDCFLLWRLTNGKSHFTDASNAARTMLFNINTQTWDDELLALFDIPPQILPTVKNNSDDFGVSNKSLLGQAIPICGMAGDQQAAAIGQCCFQKGMMKSTYGTGCFMLMNIGEQKVLSGHRLLTTVLYRFNNKVTYGLEGSIFVAGAALQWLQDTVKLITHASDAEKHALNLPDTGGVYLVPAFTGLGAPYWDPMARGAILGLTRDSGVEHIVRAALEAVCYQSKDLLHAMSQDGAKARSLRVDGGMAVNDWLMQFLADILHLDVARPKVTETTALGVAFLAGLQIGLYDSLESLSQLWQADRYYQPNMESDQRHALYQGWQQAVQQVCTK